MEFGPVIGGEEKENFDICLDSCGDAEAWT